MMCKLERLGQRAQVENEDLLKKNREQIPDWALTVMRKSFSGEQGETRPQ